MPFTQGLQGPFGDFLYMVGFLVEYTWLRLWRLLRALTRGVLRAAAVLLAAILRPPLRLLGDLWMAFHSPVRLLVGYLLPLGASACLAALVHTVLTLSLIHI